MGLVEFKAPTGSTSAAATVVALSRANDTEMFLDQDLGIPFRLSPGYRLRVEARILPSDGFRSIKESLRSRGGIVGKQRRIRFKVAECTVPAPYDVYWKIKNRGVEAAEADSLRGEIVRDQGRLRHEESTLYTGNHYVECYVVKNGVCVAMDRQPVIIT